MQIRMKIAVIGALMLILAVPLFLVVSKIYERNDYREQARADISRSWTGQQQVLGPMVVVPYTRVYEKREFDRELRQHITTKHKVQEQLFVLPQILRGDVQLDTDIRYRGIYGVAVYVSNMTLAGEVTNEKILQLYARDDIESVGVPYLSIMVNDMRGIAESPQLIWDGKPIELAPGSQLAFQNSGVHAPQLAIDRTTAKTHRFSVALSLRGMSSFHIAPIGASSSINLRSGWPHPSFEGQYLPAEREISADGFNAEWQTTAFATNIEEKADRCAAGDCASFASSYFGVVLVDPVDIYLKAQRASKYGILFIGLTFTAFFLFEVLRQFSIHPIQYTLVGLALTIFYLLLISLAEHISFAAAYGLATLACTGLLGFYITYVLRSLRRGCGFAAALAGLYGVLYIVIQEEDYAFSMGASLTFAALAGVMYATRNIDWFDIGERAFNKTEEA